MTAFLILALLAQDRHQAIDDLVRDLGDDLIEIRERAQGALLRVGPPAIPALKKAILSEDPERRARARITLLRIDRAEREREHDAFELAELLRKNRPPSPEKAEQFRWTAVTEGARFGIGAVRRCGGLVLYTSFESFLYRYDRFCGAKGDLRFDIEKACDLTGRELAIERCARCSPAMIFAKNHDGPVRIRVRGVQTWFSRYEVEFLEPRMGQTQVVGDMTIEVAWPRIKVISTGGWSADPRQWPQHRFEFDMKETARSKKPAQMICVEGGG
jgi:hypothetical protein